MIQDEVIKSEFELHPGWASDVGHRHKLGVESWKMDRYAKRNKNLSKLF